MKNVEKDVVLDEIKKEVNKNGRWYHKVVIDIFGDLIYYVYRKGMVNCFKYYNK